MLPHRRRFGYWRRTNDSRGHDVRIVETIIVIVALASIWPLIIGYQWAGTPWYKFGYMAVVLIGMAWVTVRRMTRIRSAADEAKRKRDESARSGRPPWMGG